MGGESRPMRIAFYAPMKPPDHPVPSGDRRMARLLLAALRRGGHQVSLASRIRARDGTGDREVRPRHPLSGGRRLLRREAGRRALG